MIKPDRGVTPDESDLAVEVIIQLGDREFWETISESQKRQKKKPYERRLVQ